MAHEEKAMERHRVHGTIHTDFARPGRELVARFAAHDTAKVADAMAGYGVAHPAIKPLRPEMRLCGPAFTVLTQPGDALYVQKAIDLLQPGDVVVIDATGCCDVAVIGERLAYFMKLRGAAGIVVDGAVRDSIGIVAEGIPTFCRGCCIRIFGSKGPGAINVPVTVGGVPVHPGDLVLGDADGIVVVPREDAARVIELADEHLAAELVRLEQVRSGKSVTEVFGLAPKLAVWEREDS
jgi:4-hydroxy-4-methyl-2-oxoglutarate aldolase